MVRFVRRAPSSAQLVALSASRLAQGLLVTCLLAACGASGAHSGSSSPETGTLPTPTATSLGVSPAHPTTQSQITFGFTAPVASGAHGAYQISYSLSITGRGGPACIGAHEAAAPAVAAGARASIVVGPAQLGRPWCAGSYSARVIELRRAVCKRSRPCPQFIAVVGIVARGDFRVSRS